MSGKCKVATLSFTVTLSLAGVVALLWLLGGSTPSAHADSPHYVASNCAGVPILPLGYVLTFGLVVGIIEIRIKQYLPSSLLSSQTVDSIGGERV